MNEHTRTYGTCTITLLPGWRFYVKELDRRYDSVREAEAAIDRAESNLSASSERTVDDSYPQAARVVELWLKDYCDDSLAYPEMIAVAARKAAKEIGRLEAEVRRLRSTPAVAEMTDTIKYAVQCLNELQYTWSDEPPTEPGWYWYRYVIGNFDNTCVVLVVQPERGGPYVKFHSGRSELLRDISSCVQWARVTEPQERPE